MAERENLMSHRIVRGLAGVCLVLAGLGASVAVAGTAGAAQMGKPTAPTGLAGNSHIIQGTVLTWNAVNDATSPVTKYQLAGKFGKGKHAQCKVAAPSTSCTLTGLSDGKTYKFKIRAINAIGAGPYSAPISVEVGVPNPPTGVTATALVNSASVAWSAPVGIQVSSYTVTSSGGQTCSAVVTPCTVTGLAPGTAYTFTVVANTSWADSAPSVPSASITTPDVPGVPTAVSATGTTNPATSAEVDFTAPASNGSAITGYTVVADDITANVLTDDAAPVSAATTGYTATGLTAGDDYTFAVYATNGVGSGAASTPVALVTVPGVSTGVSVSADTNPNPSAEVTFTAPDSDGGSDISGYTVVVDDTTADTVTDYAAPASAATNGYLVSPLNATDSYTFAVYATNSAGNGAASTPVAADPASPTSVTVTDEGSGVATVAWTPSDVTLGTSVNDYHIFSADLTTFTLGPSDTVSSSSTSDTLSGFTNAGDTYDVCVAAQSSQPSSEETCVSYTPGA
jgi:predicted RNA-binding protein with TRAM domain